MHLASAMYRSYLYIYTNMHLRTYRYTYIYIDKSSIRDKDKPCTCPMDATATQPLYWHTLGDAASSEPRPAGDARVQKMLEMVKTLQVAKAKLAQSGS